MNKRVGVIKEIDNLGRIVIPKDMRDRLGFGKNVEVVLTEDGIFIHNPRYKLVEVEENQDKS